MCLDKHLRLWVCAQTPEVVGVCLDRHLRLWVLLRQTPEIVGVCLEELLCLSYRYCSHGTASLIVLLLACCSGFFINTVFSFTFLKNLISCQV